MSLWRRELARLFCWLVACGLQPPITPNKSTSLCPSHFSSFLSFWWRFSGPTKERLSWVGLPPRFGLVGAALCLLFPSPFHLISSFHFISWNKIKFNSRKEKQTPLTNNPFLLCWIAFIVVLLAAACLPFAEHWLPQQPIIHKWKSSQHNNSIHSNAASAHSPAIAQSK